MTDQIQTLQHLRATLIAWAEMESGPPYDSVRVPRAYLNLMAGMVSEALSFAGVDAGANPSDGPACGGPRLFCGFGVDAGAPHVKPCPRCMRRHQYYLGCPQRDEP